MGNSKKRGLCAVPDSCLPAGPTGALLSPLIRAIGGEVSFVPSWSHASLTLTETPAGEDREHTHLFADTWAAVGSENAKFGSGLSASDLAALPLLAVTQKEHDAWRMILRNPRPQRLMRASRREADRAIRAGQALGVVSTALLKTGPAPRLKVVSRHSVSADTGLWASLDASAPAAGQGGR
ncbi:MAG: hypothetical protein MK180_03270 [Rhodobacteraceae bacterium]|nr:hypothetical protein [Paracoccaceae bacterium]